VLRDIFSQEIPSSIFIIHENNQKKPEKCLENQKFCAQPSVIRSVSSYSSYFFLKSFLLSSFDVSKYLRSRKSDTDSVFLQIAFL